MCALVGIGSQASICGVYGVKAFMVEALFLLLLFVITLQSGPSRQIFLNVAKLFKHTHGRQVVEKLSLIWVFYKSKDGRSGCKIDRIKLTHLLILARLVLGDCLCSLGNGMLGKLPREDKTNSSLDLSRRDGTTFVVSSKLGSFSSDSLKDVVDERVQEGYGLVGDTSVWVDL